MSAGAQAEGASEVKSLCALVKLEVFMKRAAQGNRRIRRARGFHRAWLIADHLNRLQDEAGGVLTEALVQQWLARQRLWA